MRYSIVIPVYNCQEYIKTAVESAASKAKNIEVILIDDGSTDQSANVCDTIASSYDNVYAYHTQNLGAGNARNVGIKNATGDFIIFLDSDDFLSEGFFNNISELKEQGDCDVIFFNTIKLFHNGYKKAMNEGFDEDTIIKRTKQEFLEDVTKFNKFPASCGGKIIKREFLIRNNIFFPTDKLGEDVDFTLNLLIKGNKFGFYKKGQYIYRQFKNSRSGKGNPKTIEDMIYTIEKWVHISENSPYRLYIMSFLAYEYAMIYPFLGALKREERQMFLKKLKELKYLLKYGKTKKLKAIKICSDILGTENTAKLLTLYIGIRDVK